jgi:hypothetical protein
VQLELAFATTRVARDIETSLRVPHDARVVDMVITTGEGKRVASGSRTAYGAAGAYQRELANKQDSGLLEYSSETPPHDVLSLRVFPLTHGEETHVELTIVLPPLDAVSIASSHAIALVDIDSGVAIKRFNDLLDGREVRLPSGIGRLDPAAVPHDAVSPHLSLLGGEAARPTVTIAQPIAHSCGSRFVDRKTIRRVIKLALPRLTHCWLKEAQGDPSIEGDVGIRFLIGPTGHVNGAWVDGTLPSDKVKACIVSDVRQWTFHEQDGAIQVTYPLTLHLLR